MTTTTAAATLATAAAAEGCGAELSGSLLVRSVQSATYGARRPPRTALPTQVRRCSSRCSSTSDAFLETLANRDDRLQGLNEESLLR